MYYKNLDDSRNNLFLFFYNRCRHDNNSCLSNKEVELMWKCIHTWKRSSINTLWCLLGCSIGDFGTILFFQNAEYHINDINIMIIATINGLITSIALETFILFKTMKFKNAFKTAMGMSLISMLGMEIAMNYTDFMLNGKAIITFQTLPAILLVGFIVPLPYNYWRLKKLGISCH